MIVRATLLHSFYDQYTDSKNEDAVAAGSVEDGVPPEDVNTALVRIARKDRQNLLLKFDAFAAIVVDRVSELTTSHLGDHICRDAVYHTIEERESGSQRAFMHISKSFPIYFTLRKMAAFNKRSTP